MWLAAISDEAASWDLGRPRNTPKAWAAFLRLPAWSKATSLERRPWLHLLPQEPRGLGGLRGCPNGQRNEIIDAEARASLEEYQERMLCDSSGQTGLSEGPQCYAATVAEYHRLVRKLLVIGVCDPAVYPEER